MCTRLTQIFPHFIPVYQLDQDVPYRKLKALGILLLGVSFLNAPLTLKTLAGHHDTLSLLSGH